MTLFAMIGFTVSGAMGGYAICGMLALRRIRYLANRAKGNPSTHDATVTRETLTAVMEGW